MSDGEQDPNDLNKRIQDAKQRIRDDNEPWPTHPDVGHPTKNFVPYATMFKHAGPPYDEGRVVCIACNWDFLYKDILDGELEEDHCPNCNVWAQNYWKDKPHRKVPANA